MIEPSLFSCVVKLRPKHSGQIPATQGHQAHAAFLDIVRTVDPALAQQLHSSGGRKPFTVSPLRGLRGRANQGQVEVKLSDELWLRFTLLDGGLFATFIQYFLQYFLGGQVEPTLRIGPLDFLVSEVLSSPGSHPWAGYTSPQELAQRWITGGKAEIAPATLAYRVALELASPTAFSLGQRGELGKWMEVFPTPRLLFGSLVSAWNRLGVYPLPAQEVIRYAEETVVVSRFKLETHMYHYRSHGQLGAQGWCAYDLKDHTRPDLACCLNLLADFAFYAGVGYHTTMGMGQVRRLPLPQNGWL